MIVYSVIVPFYKGNKYISGIFDVVGKNAKSLLAAGRNEEVELLIVNDSPDYPISVPEHSGDFTLRILQNPVNSGIHKSRVAGLAEAAGEYILFLDQDDQVADNFLLKQREVIGDADAAAANAWLEQPDGSRRKLYRSPRMMQKILKEDTYIFSHNQIASPGQCLIRKTSIPEEWKTRILKYNGSDDLFLWLLFFEKGLQIRINFEVLYTHCYTGENLSESSEKMTASTLGFADFLSGIPYFNEKNRRNLIRSRKFDQRIHAKNKGKAFLQMFTGMDILFRRAMWKIIYR